MGVGGKVSADLHGLLCSAAVGSLASSTQKLALVSSKISSRVGDTRDSGRLDGRLITRERGDMI
jgi:hypothetical protein